MFSKVSEGLGAAVSNCPAETAGGIVVGATFAVVLWEGISEGNAVAVIEGLLQPTAKQSIISTKIAVNFFMGTILSGS